MKMTRMIVAATFVATSLFAAGAFAGESERFGQLDADGNGMIFSEEAAVDPRLAEGWSAADVNGDGQLERAEFGALEQKPKMDTEK